MLALLFALAAGMWCLLEMKYRKPRQQKSRKTRHAAEKFVTVVRWSSLGGIDWLNR
jgi:uncharacterized membrane protein SpoIIM required for sporulation